jgi:hypothetical protein
MSTLKCNCGYMYSTKLDRVMFPEEGLNAMGIPVFKESADAALIPRIQLKGKTGGDMSYSAKTNIAGNGCRGCENGERLSC